MQDETKEVQLPPTVLSNYSSWKFRTKHSNFFSYTGRIHATLSQVVLGVTSERNELQLLLISTTSK